VVEKKASKEMASAAKQVHENVKRTAELDKQEAEVRQAVVLSWTATVSATHYAWAVISVPYIQHNG